MVLDRLDRYIARNVLAAIVVVQFVLLGLDITIAYIDDLGDVQAGYTALDALIYLLMRALAFLSIRAGSGIDWRADWSGQHGLQQ